MMRKLGFLLTLLVFGTTIALAQNNGGQRTFDPEEMATRQTEELTKVLDLDKNTAKEVHAILLESGKEMGKMRSEMQAGGDREAMRAQMTEMRKKQNEKFKKVFTEEQYTKYEKYLEERREQRGQRGQR
ncbi:hypothetical protein [uncultured Draconibacterium sp.]|uniref:hypothetical protein n=1 Tax=uncultured Draconibacterium sp. TaxID=1573823 RepID=UPI003217F2B6